MITQLPFVLHLTVAEHKQLVTHKPWKGKWDSDDAAIVSIKAKIRAQLIANQNCCAYCGLPFKGEKDKQIEHIAPKAKFRQPEFTFTLQNLVLSCVYCNNLIVKGSKPTVELPAHRLYKKCTFLIVHPYFDNPDIHYDWTDNGDKILIQVRNNSDKGRASIKMFELDSEGMSEMRAAISSIAKLKAAKPISVTDETLVNNTLDYTAKI
jgi:uncharacterized protein (TIGR02646 family)